MPALLWVRSRGHHALRDASRRPLRETRFGFVSGHEKNVAPGHLPPQPSSSASTLTIMSTSQARGRKLAERRFLPSAFPGVTNPPHGRQVMRRLPEVPAEISSPVTENALPSWLSLFSRLVHGVQVAWKQRPSRSVLLTGAAIVAASTALVAGSFGNGRRAFDAWTHWRAGSKIAQAEAAFDDDDLGTGFALAAEAYGGCPTNEKTLRCLAHRWEQVGSPRSLEFFDRLDQLGKLNRDDRVTQVSALINDRQFKEAQALAAELSKSAEPEARLVKLGCLIGQAGYEIPPALKAAAVETIKTMRDPARVCDLASILVSTDERDSAMSALWVLAESGLRKVARSAVKALHEHTPPSAPSSVYLAWLLTEQHGADAELRLCALDRIVRRCPDTADQLLKQTVLEWSRASLRDRTMLGRLISSCARPASLVGLFDREEAVSDPRVAELYVASLMANDRFDESVALLKDRRLLVSRAQRSYAEAVLTLHATNDEDQCRLRLLCALDAASAEANANLLIGVAELAARAGHTPVAERAYAECRHLRGAQAAALDGLISLYENTGDTEKLAATTKEAMLIWPGNERYVEKHVYACLLLGENMEQAFAVAATLHASRPADEMRLLLLSMAHARMGDTTVARSELRKLCARGGIPARYRAVIGGLLKGAGDSETASSLVLDVSDQQVPLPEEKAFLRLARL